MRLWAFRTLEKKWLLSLTSFPPGKRQEWGSGGGNSFFPQPARLGRGKWSAAFVPVACRLGGDSFFGSEPKREV